MASASNIVLAGIVVGGGVVLLVGARRLTSFNFGEWGGGFWDPIEASGASVGERFYAWWARIKLRAYLKERVDAAEDIEKRRQAEGNANYGTAGGYTGEWYGNELICHVLYATPSSSGTTRYFAGAVCREAHEGQLL
jgi:hypothetical protein